LVEARRNQALSLPIVFAGLDAGPLSVAFVVMPSFHHRLLSAPLRSKLMHPRLLNGHLNLADFRRVECAECGGLRARSLISKVTMALSPQNMWPARFIYELIRHFLFVRW